MRSSRCLLNKVLPNEQQLRLRNTHTHRDRAFRSAHLRIVPNSNRIITALRAKPAAHYSSRGILRRVSRRERARPVAVCNGGFRGYVSSLSIPRFRYVSGLFENPFSSPRNASYIGTECDKRTRSPLRPEILSPPFLPSSRGFQSFFPKLTPHSARCFVHSAPL